MSDALDNSAMPDIAGRTCVYDMAGTDVYCQRIFGDIPNSIWVIERYYNTPNWYDTFVWYYDNDLIEEEMMVKVIEFGIDHDYIIYSWIKHIEAEKNLDFEGYDFSRTLDMKYWDQMQQLEKFDMYWKKVR